MTTIDWYQQEALILAYMFVHPEEIVRKDLNEHHFRDFDTRMMYMLMKANYKYNNNQGINGHEVIDGMAKNPRFRKLLENTDLTTHILWSNPDYVVSKAVFEWYVEIQKRKD